MKLKSIYISNFCGITEFATSFNDGGIQISGANGTGKTTIFRSIAWIMQGTDEFGNRIDPGIKARVKLNIQGNSKDLIRLERINSPDGTQCFMNDNQLKVTDFESSIRNFAFNGYDPLLFINPSYLPSLHWKEQRFVVEQLVDIPDKDNFADEVSHSHCLEKICEVMDTGQTVDQLKKQARDYRKKYEQNIEACNSVIKELKELHNMGVLGEDVTNDRVGNYQKDIDLYVRYKAEKQQLIDELETFEFERARLLQDKLNGLFKDNPVYFTLFLQNKKGEYKETCQLTYSGRTWNQLSTGERIKAGLFLINVFQKQFNVNAPIVIDNYESVTQSGELNFPEISSQQIKLKTTEEEKL